MAAAFGSGFAFSLISTPGGPNVASAVGTGAFFAIIQGGFHKVNEEKITYSDIINDHVHW